MTNTPTRALNLRIASLDPNAPKAKKDCKVCNRRRIRCDRSLPTCKKCGIRDLECPGYDLKLKWDQGVASRGRLAGRALPILEKNSVTVEEPQVTTLVSISPDTNEWHACSDTGSAPAPAPSHYIIDLPLSLLNPLPDFLRRPDVGTLVHHYDQNLASTLVWIDSADNQWRKLILPLAFQEPSLLFAILALAAEHLSRGASVRSIESAKYATQAIKYRDKSLVLLAGHLRSEMQAQDTQTRDRQVAIPEKKAAKSILATMLMLCQLEMVNSESLTWRVHLQASHIMIQRWLNTPNRLDLADTTSRFLVKESFMINVFAATTNFSEDEDKWVFGDEDDDTIFGDFLRVVHEVAITERHQGSTGHSFSNDMLDLEQRLEKARLSTLNLAGRLVDLKSDRRQDFDRVVDIYHYAGNVYAYQALARPEEAAAAIPKLLAALLADLHIMPASGLFAQDLAWPLFIASTECREYPQERQWLQQKMEESANSTGFAGCHEAWDFLRKWWACEDGAERYRNWIGFARAQAHQGHTFLVL